MPVLQEVRGEGSRAEATPAAGGSCQAQRGHRRVCAICCSGTALHSDLAYKALLKHSRKHASVSCIARACCCLSGRRAAIPAVSNDLLFYPISDEIYLKGRHAEVYAFC